MSPQDVAACCRPGDDGTTLVRLRVAPRASRTEVAGRHGDAVRVRVQAPPVDGAANEAVVELLADLLDLPPSSVVLHRGARGRDKVVRVPLPPRIVVERLAGA